MATAFDQLKQVNGRKTAAYFLLPGILPRIRELGGSGFGYLAFLIASVYRAVRILPAGHPYTIPSNIGTYGIRAVIAEAANNIVFSKKNIDQIIVFGAVIAAVILLVLQFFSFVLLLMSGTAFATEVDAGGGSGSLFETTYPAKDIAFLMLDYVFGIPDFFGSDALEGGMTPYHTALHALFQFYNMAILVVAVLIFIYFVIVVVAETAMTGTPFGQRFNSIYAPLRLVAALGLLVPLNYGLNGSQYIVLFSAKVGSGFATNAWTNFNVAIGTTSHEMMSGETGGEGGEGGEGAGEGEGEGAEGGQMTPMGVESGKLLAMPVVPDPQPLIEFMSVAHACKMSYKLYTEQDLVKPYIINGDIAVDAFPTEAAEDAEGGGGEGGEDPLLTSYYEARRNANGGNIEIVFGYEDPQSEYPGNIVPHCGKISVPVNVVEDAPATEEGDSGDAPASDEEIGAEAVQEAYFRTLAKMWDDEAITALGGRFAYALIEITPPRDYCYADDALTFGIASDADKRKVRDDFYELGVGSIGQEQMNEVLLYMLRRDYVQSQGLNLDSINPDDPPEKQRADWEKMVQDWNEANPDNQIDPNFDNRHAEYDKAVNGTTASCSNSDYRPKQFIKQNLVMKYKTWLELEIRSIIVRARNDMPSYMTDEIIKRGWGGAGIWYNTIARLNGDYLGSVYNLPYATQYPLPLEEVLEEKKKTNSGVTICNMFDASFAGAQQADVNEYFVKSTAEAQSYWSCNVTTQTKGNTTNVLWDTMHVLFGIRGLFDMKENNNDGVHPLAQLTAVGKGLVDSAVRNLATAMLVSAGGGLMRILEPFTGAGVNMMAQAASGFLVTLATIGLSVGFLLFYILPFMPFIYFFFAVGSWVKSIFEAMVGAPLWALAHLRIDGDGFPGKGGINGYFLIFEIFLRPILTVAGLLGGMAIFTASMVILNEIFNLAVLNLTGVDLEGGASDLADASGLAQILDKHIMDEFFYTIMYAVLTYMIATGCFKMIDMVPNNILRFMGASVASFSDNAGDPTEGLAQYAAISGATIGGNIAGGLTQASSAVGTGIAGVFDTPGHMQRQADAANNPQGGNQ